MYRRKLPLTRELHVGVDLPVWFISDLKAIDKRFVFVYHKWRLIWDDVMNGHTGSIDDPRFCIGEFQGRECWGWPLRDNEGNPVPDERWHLWRFAPDYGWSHIIDVDSYDPDHLKRIVGTIHEHSIMSAMGAKRYAAWKQSQEEVKEEKRIELAGDKFDFLEKENRKLTRDAMENFEFGRTAPTNPTKDIIISYPGQKNRSRIVRPLDDKDAGLTTWEDLD